MSDQRRLMSAASKIELGPTDVLVLNLGRSRPSSTALQRLRERMLALRPDWSGLMLALAPGQTVEAISEDAALRVATNICAMRAERMEQEQKDLAVPKLEAVRVDDPKATPERWGKSFFANPSLRAALKTGVDLGSEPSVTVAQLVDVASGEILEQHTEPLAPSPRSGTESSLTAWGAALLSGQAATPSSDPFSELADPPPPIAGG